MSARYAEVNTVLYRVLFLNLAVALAKIILGYFTGAVSIVSDGFHSLTDSASNVVALIGVSVARQPPDAKHPYGHRKYETMASLGILVFLVVVLHVLTGRPSDGFTSRFWFGLLRETVAAGVVVVLLLVDDGVKDGRALGALHFLAEQVIRNAQFLLTLWTLNLFRHGTPTSYR